MLNLNAAFAEQCQVVSAFVPVDLQTAANTGDWVSMKGYERCTFIFFAAAGTAGDDPTITALQTVDVADTGSVNKAVSFAGGVVYTKMGTLTAVGEFTKSTTTTANTHTDATSAEVQKIWVVDIKGEDLDVDGGFDCVRVSVGDVGGNAQLGCGLYILWGARYGKPALLSAIVD